MKQLDNAVEAINKFQQKHPPLAFIYAVLKKYGEDNAGHQAALLTYYAFLSLFPLLLVVATVASILAHGHPDVQANVIRSATNYFPVLGTQLAEHINSLHKSGVALVIGLVFIVYGARGVAEAFRQGIQNIWHVPRVARDGFPISLLKNLSLIVVGGTGFILASISAGVAANAGHGWLYKLLPLLLNVLILYWLFRFLLLVSLHRHARAEAVESGAAVAAVGLVILQTFGSYLLKRELKSLDALYSYFALSLGLLFWLYLQSQVVFYAIEIASVKSKRLWPRSFNENLTYSDKEAYSGLATKEKMVHKEEVNTKFKANKN